MTSHPALGQLPSLVASPVASLSALECKVRRRPMVIGVMTDEEVTLLDAAAANEVDAPRLARHPVAEQDVARSTTMILLHARGEVDLDGPDIQLTGPHAAVTAMREEAVRRALLVVLPDESDGFHAVVDRIGDRALAMARIVDRRVGIQTIVAATPEHAMAWTLKVLGVVEDRDTRRHPRQPSVQRRGDPSALEPPLHRLESDADVVIAVMATTGPASSGPMTVTSGPLGVHLHRGFTTPAGQDHTLTTLSPVALASALATLLDPPDPPVVP
ncbi:MAG TPA: hypothetical protein VJ978_06300 [Nitriliruptoraceae bacterium]|nr:hypothetical protein [Nitriliruptoraceae bacterium]